MNIKEIIYFILFAIVTPISAHEHQLAACAMFQNEGRFLKEWLEFNMLVGVEHFYLYNNHSTDNYAEVLKPYIDAGIVDCINWPYFFKNDSAQINAYNHCLNKVRGKVKWLIFIDLDEFLFPVQCDNLHEFLKDYEEFGAVCANWVMFGTSHVDKIPNNKLMIETLILSAGTVNKHIKSIIQPEKVKSFTIHDVAEFYPPYFQVTADKIRFNGPFMPSGNIDKLRINHYWTGDNTFLQEIKIERRIKQLLNNTNVSLSEKEIRQRIIEDAATMNQQEDLIIQKYVNKLKKAMLKK